MAVDLRPGRGIEDHFLPRVRAVQPEERSARIQLGPPEMRIGVHPCLDPGQEVPQEWRLLRGSDQGKAGYRSFRLLVLQFNPRHQPLSLGPLEAQVSPVQGDVPGPRCARNHKVFQGDLARLVTAKAGRQDLLPTSETGWQSPLEKNVAMGWVVAMKAAEPPGRLVEELLLQVVSRTLLPPMEGLKDLQEPGPVTPVPS